VKDDGEVYYEVDIVNKKGQAIGVRLISNKEVQEKDKQKLVQYLENYLIDEDRYSQMF
jgi:hypothetical protein